MRRWTRTFLPVVTLATAGVASAEEAGKVEPTQRAACPAERGGRFSLFFDRLVLRKAVQTMADLTCKSFVLAPGTEDVPLTVVMPKGATLTAEEAYALFLQALAPHRLQAEEKGAFVVISPQR